MLSFNDILMGSYTFEYIRIHSLGYVSVIPKRYYDADIILDEDTFLNCAKNTLNCVIWLMRRLFLIFILFHYHKRLYTF